MHISKITYVEEVLRTAFLCLKYFHQSARRILVPLGLKRAD